jgi:predicted DNA-binding transcriptional regulator YafY
MLPNRLRRKAMRADRLLSLLMLLQKHGCMTAGELSEALEVSERTIYRDIEALSGAGVPVYGETGRNGGYALLEGYRTSLTGLTEGEMRALFMLSIPAPLVELGLSQELRAALLKLSAALPAWRNEHEKEVRQRFYLDSTWWHQGGAPVPHLQSLYQAIWQDRMLNLTYRLIPSVEITQNVAPYGLVAKAGVWYLVFERMGKVQALRVSSLLDVRTLDEPFRRPEDFDLETFWKDWCAGQELRQRAYPVRVRAAPHLVQLLAMAFGEGFLQLNTQEQKGESEQWVHIELTFESLEAARERLLAYGGSIEVLEPRALRLSMWDYARQIGGRYADLERG